MKFLITVLVLTSTVFSYGQGEPQLSMYWNNYTLFNPANTGLNYKHYFNTSYRNQWTGVVNAPQIFAGQYSIKVDAINSGFGIGSIVETFGITNSQKYYFNYAYHLKLNTASTLSLGVSTAIQRMKYTGGLIPPQTGNELTLPIINAPETKLNINFGALFKKNNLEIGASFTQINQPYFNNLHYKNQIHVFLMGSYQFELSDLLSYKPSVFIKSTFYISDIGIINQLTYNKTYWFGVNYYVNSNQISVNLGADILQKYRFGYCFEYNMANPLYKYPSHEFTVGFLFK